MRHVLRGEFVRESSKEMNFCRGPVSSLCGQASSLERLQESSGNSCWRDDPSHFPSHIVEISVVKPPPSASQVFLVVSVYLRCPQLTRGRGREARLRLLFNLVLYSGLPPWSVRVGLTLPGHGWCL